MRQIALSIFWVGLFGTIAFTFDGCSRRQHEQKMECIRLGGNWVDRPEFRGNCLWNRAKERP